MGSFFRKNHFVELAVVSFWIVMQMSSQVSAASKKPLPDLPPDMTGADYFRLKGRITSFADSPNLPAKEFAEILKVGERNLIWIDFMNKSRAADQKLSFTSKATAGGIPIDHAREYNPTTIQNDYDKVAAQLPPEMRAVLIEGAALTQDPPIAVADYLAWGLKVDRSYQMAVRWILYEPYLQELAKRQSLDVRGYYFLSRLTDRSDRLAHFAILPAADQQQTLDWLVQLCSNAVQEIADCKSEVTQLTKSNSDLNPFYAKYESSGHSTYRSFFDIPTPAARRDIIWESKVPQTATLNFLDPNDNIQRTYLMNIEDEWRWNGWGLHLTFVSGSPNDLPHMIYKPGVTPHVNQVGGNEITMNSDQPITEYDAQWTIRHEFGHVLGFPDCYLEYYDQDRATIVSYQMDTSDLMCSRMGHMNQRLYDEMARNYLKQ